MISAGCCISHKKYSPECSHEHAVLSCLYCQWSLNYVLSMSSVVSKLSYICIANSVLAKLYDLCLCWVLKCHYWSWCICAHIARTYCIKMVSHRNMKCNILYMSYEPETYMSILKQSLVCNRDTKRLSAIHRAVSLWSVYNVHVSFAWPEHSRFNTVSKGHLLHLVLLVFKWLDRG